MVGMTKPQPRLPGESRRAPGEVVPAATSLADSFADAHAADPDPELAASLVRTAGRLARAMRTRSLTTDRKTSVSDIVTNADRAAEAFVGKALERLRPEDGVLGEEGADRGSESGRTWVIDPVDGTYNFAQGSDYWCSAVALTEGDPARGRVILGAVHRPDLDTTWLGGPRLPTTSNGAAVGTLPDAPLSELSVGTYLDPRFLADEGVRGAWLSIATRCATIRMLGAGSVDLAGVATGRLGAWVQHSVPPWDWLPGKALVIGAGGVATTQDAAGRTWHIAGGPRVVAECAKLLDEWEDSRPARYRAADNPGTRPPDDRPEDPSGRTPAGRASPRPARSRAASLTSKENHDV